MSESPTFLGYYNPDKKRTPLDKLGDAISRYEAKFGLVADTALVGRGYIAPDMFYVGRQGEAS